MLSKFTTPLTKLVDKYLPDPFVIVLLLTFLVMILAALFTPATPVMVLEAWGNGFWKLLTFAMQMLLVLLCGHMLAVTPPIAKALDRIAGLAKTPSQAIILTTFVAMSASWLNWGFGLVVGALFAKAIARKVKVDYRLLVASAYSGFVVWHAGLSGSVPLTIATPGHFSEKSIGIVTTSETIFAPFNLLIVLSIFIVLPLINTLMLPKDDDAVIVDKEKLIEQSNDISNRNTPAAKLENASWLGMLGGAIGLSYLGFYFIFNAGTLTLNIVIALFLFLAMLLHKTPANILNSLQQAIQGGAGIVIQFPFYAGIMAMMVETGLAQQISQGFVSISSQWTLPLWSFLSAGLVNIFVPSGGGQWAVQAPIIIPAAEALNADIARVAMAVAWGDAWTNLIQPFWALPVLAIAGLKAKDIMGFCLIQLLVTGVIIATLLLLPL
ncbi:short-chain fatty acid transporter [Pseudoalteromonas piscicida]|uniref:Short-chain fatty acid transporter n=1 Tax=Pseudoalteromonas piscicida TaxID=43662 RepID=A0AAQ2ERM3_PSEO7|nr:MULTISPECIES: TIGR00366 family protein [Pseudoalteromonas]KJY86409.1 short-chain fatty acid transporter [Pseudoalteromonas piscicida]TMN36270.1 short-chain fatty acid transporter [Pseudoalteromonas piscicida]TMN38791.1 short-chain fatty acid transporter [Pseudoalteromonas piscicida]TMN47248.1 short-chain fatty acid transporter [Pseudoalteromonas piscicida]TMN48309.1 short-chain fatty acid transporter [Pseudoalteromonas piscicida]